MSEMTQTGTLGELRPANLAELEAELSALWRASVEGTEIRHPVTRSCSLTLLVYVESEKEGREVLDLIDKVTPENPCRAVIMIAEPTATPSGLSAKISARCHQPVASEKEVCCEQVSLLARGEAVAGLDQVVIPLMVPGLPVYVWWRAGCFIPPGYLNLILRSADRVLVDSARFPDPEADLPRLANEVRRLSDVVFTDLNWARLTPWRELIAQCFDSSETRPYLDQLTEVRIEYEQYSPRVLVHRAQSLLLTAWLASRLGWQQVPEAAQTAGGSRLFRFRSAERSIRVEHFPHQFEGGGAGVCFSLTLRTGGPSPAIFSLQRGPDGRTALIRRELPKLSMMEHAVHLRVLDEVELLNGEIKFLARDRVYEEVVDMVARLTVHSS
jgi:glucose-6-phosphate dehydrogenase assembly protein OpcA